MTDQRKGKEWIAWSGRILDVLEAFTDVEIIRNTSDNPMSLEFAALLALVYFDGYELFPTHDRSGQSEDHRDV